MNASHPSQYLLYAPIRSLPERKISMGLAGRHPGSRLNP